MAAAVAAAPPKTIAQLERELMRNYNEVVKSATTHVNLSGFEMTAMITRVEEPKANVYSRGIYVMPGVFTEYDQETGEIIGYKDELVVPITEKGAKKGDVKTLPIANPQTVMLGAGADASGAAASDGRPPMETTFTFKRGHEYRLSLNSDLANQLNLQPTDFVLIQGGTITGEWQDAKKKLEIDNKRKTKSTDPKALEPEWTYWKNAGSMKKLSSGTEALYRVGIQQETTFFGPQHVEKARAEYADGIGFSDEQYTIRWENPPRKKEADEGKIVYVKPMFGDPQDSEIKHPYISKGKDGKLQICAKFTMWLVRKFADGTEQQGISEVALWSESCSIFGFDRYDVEYWRVLAPRIFRASSGVLRARIDNKGTTTMGVNTTGSNGIFAYGLNFRPDVLMIDVAGLYKNRIGIPVSKEWVRQKFSASVRAAPATACNEITNLTEQIGLASDRISRPEAVFRVVSTVNFYEAEDYMKRLAVFTTQQGEQFIQILEEGVDRETVVEKKSDPVYALIEDTKAYTGIFKYAVFAICPPGGGSTSAEDIVKMYFGDESKIVKKEKQEVPMSTDGPEARAEKRKATDPADLPDITSEDERMAKEMDGGESDQEEEDEKPPKKLRGGDA
jgi:hypothetical protein